LYGYLEKEKENTQAPEGLFMIAIHTDAQSDVSAVASHWRVIQGEYFGRDS
jgi:hypothetical protein